jgi:hypothetical protein
LFPPLEAYRLRLKGMIWRRDKDKEKERKQKISSAKKEE